MRKQRQEQLEAHVEAVNQALRNAIGPVEDQDEDGDGDEWEGIGEMPEEIRREDEYVDEDKYTTVTVETVDVTRNGFGNPDDESAQHNNTEPALNKGNDREAQQARNAESRKTDAKKKPKKPKKKKFRYENKEARKLSREKEGRKNSSQARKRKADK
jgi:ribosomal RNA-processing protein 17